MKNKKIKKVYLSGGFGNIMFQFVLINRLIDLGYKVIIYDNFITNNFITKNILRWKIQNDFYKIYFENNNIRINHAGFVESLIDLSIFYFSKILKIPVLNYLYNPTASELSSSFSKNNMFMGYFQNKTFLENSRSAINITVKSIRKFVIVNPIDNCAHFRGGDTGYLNYNLAILEKSLKHLKNITIVTDDTLKLESLLRNKNLSIVSNKPLVDFSSLCSARKTLICSNSTFSWWAANIVDNDVNIIMPLKLYETLGFYQSNNIKIIE
jgi:hypothetical protein